MVDTEKTEGAGGAPVGKRPPLLPRERLLELMAQFYEDQELVRRREKALRQWSQAASWPVLAVVAGIAFAVVWNRLFVIVPLVVLGVWGAVAAVLNWREAERLRRQIHPQDVCGAALKRARWEGLLTPDEVSWYRARLPFRRGKNWQQQYWYNLQASAQVRDELIREYEKRTDDPLPPAALEDREIGNVRRRWVKRYPSPGDWLFERGGGAEYQIDPGKKVAWFRISGGEYGESVDWHKLQYRLLGTRVMVRLLEFTREFYGKKRWLVVDSVVQEAELQSDSQDEGAVAWARRSVEWVESRDVEWCCWVLSHHVDEVGKAELQSYLRSEQGRIRAGVASVNDLAARVGVTLQRTKETGLEAVRQPGVEWSPEEGKFWHGLKECLEKASITQSEYENSARIEARLAELLGEEATAAQG